MKLSEQLKRARADRPDEWTMDRYITKAKEMEEALESIITPDRPDTSVMVFQDHIDASSPETEFWKKLSSVNSPQTLEGSPHRNGEGTTTLIYEGGKIVGATICQRDSWNRTVLICVELHAKDLPLFTQQAEK